MFKFKHMKTPTWASHTDVYFVVLDENLNEFAYIGLQDLDLVRGVCNNLCYKTSKRFRGKGKSKEYLKEFLEWCPLNFDLIKASAKKDNIASIKMLEYCGFTKQPLKASKLDKEIALVKKEIEFKKVLDKQNENLGIKVGEYPLKIDPEKKLEELIERRKNSESNYFTYRLKKFDY